MKEKGYRTLLLVVSLISNMFTYRPRGLRQSFCFKLATLCRPSPTHIRSTHGKGLEVKEKQISANKYYIHFINITKVYK
jgi:hypothetical protein